MRQVEVLCEEQSAEAVLDELLLRMIGERANYSIRTFEGLHALLRHLPNRLNAYRRKIVAGEDLRILVLIDEDRAPEGCLGRKQLLEEIARGAGLRTKAKVPLGRDFDVVNRIAVEELEAWFFGDLAAIRSAYPSISEAIYGKAIYRDPDSIQNGTAERLLKELQIAGYYRDIDFLPKIEVGRRIARYMNIDNNRSNSFSVFRQGISAILST